MAVGRVGPLGSATSVGHVGLRYRLFREVPLERNDRFYGIPGGHVARPEVNVVPVCGSSGPLPPVSAVVNRWDR